jgi:predicted PurR-regulated permease PerM
MNDAAGSQTPLPSGQDASGLRPERPGADGEGFGSPPAFTDDESAAVALPDGRKLFFRFFIVLLLFSLYLLFYLVQPFLHSIILACAFTAISHPVYRRCLSLTRGRKVPAALIVLSCITLVLTALIWIFVAGLIPQARSSISAVNLRLAGADWTLTPGGRLDPLLDYIHAYFPEFNLTIEDLRQNMAGLSRDAGQVVIRYASSLLGNALMFFGYLLLTLLIMFFLFIDGEALVARLSYLLPLKPARTRVVMESLRKVSRSVLVGGVAVAVLQGVVGGIGLALVGIPALFWGAVMVFAALVPVVGTGLVWVPAVISLALTDEWRSAVFLGLWCGILVTGIDSILRPIILRGGARVPLLFIFMAILGGVHAFGVPGLLYGPMILGLVAAMLDMYAEEFRDVLNSRQNGTRQRE